MAYAKHEDQIEAMRLWRERRTSNNRLKELGMSNADIKLLNETINNKSWRMSHLYKIRNKEGKIVIFKPNRAQSEFIEGAHCKNIILKSRQLGFTTYECIDNLDDTLFEPNNQALMIFHTKIAAEDAFFNKISLAWENIPESLKNKFGVDRERAGEMVFKHAPGIYSSIACRTSGMSGTFSRLHVSEFAPLCEAEPAKGRELVTGTFPSIPDSGRIDIESTARGNIGQYYDMFTTSMKRYLKADEECKKPTGKLNNPKVKLDSSDFKPWFFNWTYDDEEIENIRNEFFYTNKKDSHFGKEKKSVKEFLSKVHPEILKYALVHQLDDLQIIYYWRKIKSKGLSFEAAWKIIKQEYPTTIDEAFEAKTDHLFDLEKIKELQEKTRYGEQAGSWTYFRDYKPNHIYGIGVDVAEGIGRDSSAITVLDFGVSGADQKTNAEVVATYTNNKIAPDILAYEIRNIARIYGNPIVAVERNNTGGGSTLTELKNIYTNLFSEVRTDKLTNIQTDRLGWLTNASSKTKMFYDIKTAVDEDKFVCPSKVLLDEMASYNRDKLNKVKTNKDETNHWDLLTSAAIAYQMKEYAKPSRKRKTVKKEESFDRFGIV